MAITIEEALKHVYENTTKKSLKILPIEQVLGMVLAEDIVASHNLPPYDNSAMDGYAVKVNGAGKLVKVTHTIFAGDDSKEVLECGFGIKIMTGAKIPYGTGCIVPIEDVNLANTSESSQGTEVKNAHDISYNITLPSNLEKNRHIRFCGEDIKKDTVFLAKGEIINAYTIASLASQGITHVTVTRVIKVAIFGTGDELRPHFEKIEAHQLYNSNSPMFLARSKELGCDVRFIRTSADTLEALEASIKSTLDADIIITSGGVSVGDKDFTKEAFTNLGMQVHIDKIDIKPGRPTIVGSIGKTVIINLPGNPLASMVNYELFIRAIIRKMSGRNDHYHGNIETTMKNDFSVRGGKHAVVLGKFDGKSFEPLKSQMPGMVSPMQEADGLILITPDVKVLEAGKTVHMIPIKWEFTTSSQEELFTS